MTVWLNGRFFVELKQPALKNKQYLFVLKPQGAIPSQTKTRDVFLAEVAPVHFTAGTRAEALLVDVLGWVVAP